MKVDAGMTSLLRWALLILDPLSATGAAVILYVTVPGSANADLTRLRRSSLSNISLASFHNKKEDPKVTLVAPLDRTLAHSFTFPLSLSVAILFLNF